MDTMVKPDEEWIYLWRQLFVVSSAILHTLGVNFLLTFPSVLNSAILNPNTTDIKATSDEASWIATSNGISGVFGFIIVPYIMDKFGRKIDFIFLDSCMIISWLIFIFAKNIGALITARVIQGIAMGGMFTISLVVSEYSHPKRRGYFTAIKRCVSTVGILVSHSLMLICGWRQIAMVATVPSILSLIVTMFWPESPAHLAAKGRFDECEKSYHWLHGFGREKELKELIDNQKVSKKKPNLLKQLRNPNYLKCFWLLTLVSLVLSMSGKYYFIVYIIQMLQEIFGDSTIATYCTIGADCLSIVALFLSCFIIKFVNRRSILITYGGLSTVLLMYLIGIVSLFPLKIVWLIPLIMLVHFFVVNLCILPVCFTLYGELMPLEFRGLGSCLSGMVFTFFYAVTMKMTPILMEFTGIGGTYTIYATCVTISLVILYYYLPETKDVSLQEIENKICNKVVATEETDPMVVNNKDFYK